jgi:PAS domain S-box-containing protein
MLTSLDFETLLFIATLASVAAIAAIATLLRREHAARVALEARARRSGEHFHAVLEGMAQAMVVLDASGNVVEVNAAALILSGYRNRADLIGRNVDEFTLGEEGRPSVAAYLLSQPEGFKQRGVEITSVRRDGSKIRARMSLGDHGSGADRIFSVTLGDLEHTRQLGALQASETQLRQITDAVPALIAYVDKEQRFRFHNRAYESTFGLTREQVQGRSLAEVFGEELYQAIRAKVDEVLSGYPVRFERSQVEAGGEMRIYSEHYFPRYSDEDGSSVIGFYSLATDITEMKRIDRMKSEFVSMVSHELRTPLTSIRGSLGLIAGGVAGDLSDAATRLIDIAKNNCERLIRLVNDILDTEKMESGKMRFEMNVVELEPVVAQSIVANEGYAAQREVTFRLTGSGEPMRVHVDRDGLSQVVTNLLSNAVKFSPRGAVVEVAISSVDGRVRVEIRDHGSGIPDEFRDRIFQKFAQADSSDSRQSGGSGLGLNIAKGIVERLGGAIGFTTQAGAGTTFHFELPEWREPLESDPAGGQAPRRPRVLVCEDDPDIAKLIAMILDKAGYDADIAFTAARSRELALTGAYAAMTVDLRLPDQDGMLLMRGLRDDERTRLLPFVVVSAISAEGRVRLNSETLSVHDWLEKPIDENRLVIAIRDSIAGASRAKPHILHVEDDPDIQTVSAAIVRDFATFDCAATLAEARALLAAKRYDLVLLDLNLAEGLGAGWTLVPDIEALEPPPPIVIFTADDVSEAGSRRVAAVLVKAQTSNDQLLETIQRVLDHRPRKPAGTQGASIAQAA